MIEMKEIIRQKISNHPLITDVEGYVVITRISDNADVWQILITTHVEYFRFDVDVTSTFQSNIPNWNVTNDYEVEVRDGENQIVIDEETQESIKMPAFDYFQAIILENKIPLISLLSVYILNDDAKGAFNF